MEIRKKILQKADKSVKMLNELKERKKMSMTSKVSIANSLQVIDGQLPFASGAKLDKNNQ